MMLMCPVTLRKAEKLLPAAMAIAGEATSTGVVIGPDELLPVSSPDELVPQPQTSPFASRPSVCVLPLETATRLFMPLAVSRRGVVTSPEIAPPAWPEPLAPHMNTPP